MKLTERINELRYSIVDINQQREHLQKSYDVEFGRMCFYQSLMNAIKDAGGDPDAFTDIDSATIGELADALDAYEQIRRELGMGPFEGDALERIAELVKNKT